MTEKLVGWYVGSLYFEFLAIDGIEFNVAITIFPYNISLTQIYGVPKGIVEITYQVMIQEEVVDGNGNVTIQNVPAQDSVSYEVDFQ